MPRMPSNTSNSSASTRCQTGGPGTAPTGVTGWVMGRHAEWGSGARIAET